MNKISSGFTTYNKYILPALWLGFLAYIAYQALLSDAAWDQPLGFVGLAFMAGAVFVAAWYFWAIADEVILVEAGLRVRRRGQEELIPLSDVMNVEEGSGLVTLITLQLRSPCRFGKKVYFIPAVSASFNPFAKSKVAENLIMEVDKARRRGAG